MGNGDYLISLLAGLTAPALTGAVKRLFGAGWPESAWRKLGVFALFTGWVTIVATIVAGLTGALADVGSLAQIVAVAVAIGSAVFRVAHLRDWE